MDNMPLLYVSYIYTENQTLIIPAYYYTWNIVNTDGTLTQIIGENFFHPLDRINSLPQIIIPYTNNLILLTFSEEPSSYTVQYWIVLSGSHQDSNKTKVNYIQVSGNHLLLLPNTEENYVIQVSADWPDGTIIYDFYVSRKFR